MEASSQDERASLSPHLDTPLHTAVVFPEGGFAFHPLPDEEVTFPA